MSDNCIVTPNSYYSMTYVVKYVLLFFNENKFLRDYQQWHTGILLGTYLKEIDFREW